MGKGAHIIFQDLGAKVLAIVTGKPAPQHTDETPAVQPAGALPYRIIHQDEARGDKGVVWRAYLAQQPVLNPRIVKPEGAEKTGPKRVSHLGYVQEVVPQYVQPGRTTDGMQRVESPHTPIPEAKAQVEQVRAFDPSQLPEWIQALRNGSLLVPGQEYATEAPKDAMLMTLRPGSVSEPLPKIDINSNTLASVQAKRRSQPLDVPGRDELPTTPSLDRIIEHVLPPFIGDGEMPNLTQEAFAEHVWINGELPPLADLPSGELAVADKVNRFEVVEEDCKPSEDNQPTLLHERTVRERMFKQAISGLLESE